VDEYGAAAVGGAVTRLTGNHEWVTIRGVNQGALFAQFVPREDLQSFGGWAERQESFSPSGKYGKMIRDGFDVTTVERLEGVPLSATLFVHAGVTLKMVKKYDAIAQKENAASDTTAALTAIDVMKREGKQMLVSNNLETELLNEILQTRHQAGNRETKAVCEEILAILKLAKAERMVVGHTPTQKIGAADGHPLVRCGGRFILNDVAMSKWMGGGMPAAFVLEGDDETGEVKRIYVDHGSRAGRKQTEVPVLPPLVDASLSSDSESTKAPSETATRDEV